MVVPFASVFKIPLSIKILQAIMKTMNVKYKSKYNLVHFIANNNFDVNKVEAIKKIDFININGMV